MNTQTSNRETQMRVLLLQGEIQRIESNYRGLRVRTGKAWITVNGRDLVLRRGEDVALEAPHDAAVMSALGHAPLVVELLGEAPCQPSIDPRLVTSTL